MSTGLILKMKFKRVLRLGIGLTEKQRCSLSDGHEILHIAALAPQWRLCVPGRYY